MLTNEEIEAALASKFTHQTFMWASPTTGDL